MSETIQNLETKAIDTVGILAADAVQKAQSGHPGTAVSQAPMGPEAMNYSL